MSYHLQITFMHDTNKTMNIVLPEGKLDDFFKKMKESEPFMHEESKVGFWTDPAKVLHILISPHVPKQDKEEKVEAKEDEKQDGQRTEDGEPVLPGNEVDQ